MTQGTPLLVCCGHALVWKGLSGGYDWVASCPNCWREFGYQGPFVEEVHLPTEERKIIATDEESNSCGATCPVHGEPCPISIATKDSPEAIEFVSMMTGKELGESHRHLCLANPDEPHSWTDQG